MEVFTISPPLKHGDNQAEISCELSARKMIYMKYQALFSLKTENILALLSATILNDTSRV